VYIYNFSSSVLKGMGEGDDQMSWFGWFIEVTLGLFSENGFLALDVLAG
jgi:hypothetical protein